MIMMRCISYSDKTVMFDVASPKFGISDNLLCANRLWEINIMKTTPPPPPPPQHSQQKLVHCIRSIVSEEGSEWDVVQCKASKGVHCWVRSERVRIFPILIMQNTNAN